MKKSTALLINKSDSTLHEFDLGLFPYTTCSSDMVTSDFFLFADHKRLLARKNFCDNEKIIAKIRDFWNKRPNVP